MIQSVDPYMIRYVCRAHNVLYVKNGIEYYSYITVFNTPIKYSYMHIYISTFFCEKSLIRHHFVLSYLLFYCPRKETTCPIGFLGQFYVRKVTCPQSADGVFISKNAFIDDIQIRLFSHPAEFCILYRILYDLNLCINWSNPNGLTHTLGIRIP